MKSKQLIIKDDARGVALLKLTTDRHEASRGLSATAELLVLSNRLISDTTQFTVSARYLS